MPFWCKSEGLTACIWQEVGVSAPGAEHVSSQEIQAKLYLPTVSCGGGAPHRTAWSYLGLSMWAHKHRFYRIAALHWGVQRRRRQTEPHIYTYIYTTHSLHSLWVTTSETDSVYIYTNTGYIDLVQFEDTKNVREKQMQTCFHSFLETDREAEGRGNFGHHHFSWTKIACF